jgi:hypothetical protein
MSPAAGSSVTTIVSWPQVSRITRIDEDTAAIMAAMKVRRA